MKEAVVPLRERKPNEVDSLLLKVKQIRKNCRHDFRLVEKPKLVESLVKAVYIGGTQGSIEIKGAEDRTVRFSLVCLKCSEETETFIYSACPLCLGRMQQGNLQNPVKVNGEWVYSRTRYFGTEYSYYAIRLHSCVSCGFTVACDEWNQ